MDYPNDLYVKNFNLLTDSTNEYIHINKILVSSILPKLITRNTLLDIGSGSGNICIPLAHYFKHVSIVEPIHKYAIYVAEEILNAGSIVTVETREVGDLNSVQQYDLIICSHVFYYINTENWPALINGIVDCLNIGGKAVFILVEDNNPLANCLDKFNPSGSPDRVYAHQLRRLLSQMNLSYENHVIRNSISILSLTKAIQILEFMIGTDRGHLPSTFVPYIKKEFSTSDNFKIDYSSSLIVLSK